MDWLKKTLDKENFGKLSGQGVTSDAILFNLLENELEEYVIPLFAKDKIGLKAELRRRWRDSQRLIAYFKTI